MCRSTIRLLTGLWVVLRGKRTGLGNNWELAELFGKQVVKCHPVFARITLHFFTHVFDGSIQCLVVVGEVKFLFKPAIAQAC